MTDIRNEEAEASETERQAEWARQEEEARQPATVPDADPDLAALDAAATDGQAAEAPPADGSDAARPADSGPSDDDLWKDAPPALRDAYQAKLDELANVSNTAKSHEGRITAATRRALELEAELTALRDQAKPKEEEEAGPVLDEETRTRLGEEYPDVAAPLLAAIGALEKTQARLLERDASREEQTTVAKQLEAQRFYAEQEQQLAVTHPDWRETCASPKFAEWVNSQPQFVKEGIARNGSGIVDAAEAAKIVGMFKDETGVGGDKLAAKRDRQLGGNRLPIGKVPGATTTTTTDREAEWKRLDALDARKAAKR